VVRGEERRLMLGLRGGLGWGEGESEVRRRDLDTCGGHGRRIY
jgi:hypothetical protein